MGKTFKKLFWITAGTVTAWAVALRPRIKGKPDMTVFSAYDYADGGLHAFCKGIPDNTLPAFEKALRHGYGIVIDVRITKDGVPVAFSDNSLWRLCAQDSRVEDITYDRLKEMRLAEMDIVIPTLKEVLEYIDGQVPVLLDLNVNNNFSELCEAVAVEVDQYDGVIAIESGDYRCIRWFMRYRPKVIRGIRYEKTVDFGSSVSGFLGRIAQNMLLTNCMTRPDFISAHKSDRKGISLRLCRLLYRVPVMNWNITSLKEYETARNEDAIVVFEGIEP